MVVLISPRAHLSLGIPSGQSVEMQNLKLGQGCALTPNLLRVVVLEEGLAEDDLQTVRVDRLFGLFYAKKAQTHNERYRCYLAVYQ